MKVSAPATPVNREKARNLRAPDALRYCTAEGQKPCAVDGEVEQVAVHQHVGHEGRELGRRAAGPVGRAAGVARRNNRERVDEPGVVVGRKKRARDVNGREQGDHANARRPAR